MKVGVIRCQQAEDVCIGNTDFTVAKEGNMAFENIKDAIKKRLSPEIAIIEWTH
ncbi:MAG TPA: CGGC domain-containing protein [Halobacteria archaeon]|nr:CGGC domain-containing protein [Halobacteria archaeon]